MNRKKFYYLTLPELPWLIIVLTLKEKEARKSKRDFMKTTITLILLTLSFWSCVTREACERKFPNNRTDSFREIKNTITTIRDTTVFLQIPGDTVFESVPASGNESSNLKTSLAISAAWIEDGKLNHRLEQKDTSVASNIKGAIKTTRQLESKNEITNKTEYINRITGWQWFQIYLGRFFLLILVLLTLWVLLKKTII